MNEAIRRKLAKAEELPTTIGEWQKRAVRLDRNQRQSRAEERVLGKNTACPGGNAQPREGRSYGERGGQIMWRTGGGNRGGGGENMSNRERAQMGPRKDPNTMDVDRERGGDRTCYVCGKWDHMAKNCWERYRRRVVKTLQESAKENGGQ